MSKTILAVDDSASLRQLVSYTLRNAGFTVIEAADGQDALEKLKGPVHLVLTDLNMPRLDGFGLTRAIRASADHRYTPVLLLTTESEPARKLEGKAAGATGWLVKPFQPEQLLATIRKVLG
jgi:two-component system, chemotaxis family, chemotaxis protein CheY